MDTYALKSKMLKPLLRLLLTLLSYPVFLFYVDDDGGESVVAVTGFVSSLVNPYFDCIGYSRGTRLLVLEVLL
jgi:hypothetical protein